MQFYFPLDYLSFPVPVVHVSGNNYRRWGQNFPFLSKKNKTKRKYSNCVDVLHCLKENESEVIRVLHTCYIHVSPAPGYLLSGTVLAQPVLGKPCTHHSLAGIMVSELLLWLFKCPNCFPLISVKYCNELIKGSQSTMCQWKKK